MPGLDQINPDELAKKGELITSRMSKLPEKNNPGSLESSLYMAGQAIQLMAEYISTLVNEIKGLKAEIQDLKPSAEDE